MTDTATYTAPGHPDVTVERDGSTLTVTVAGITGLAPVREPNDEEQAFGVTSLLPPTGSTTRGETRLIDIAVRATHAALESQFGALDVAAAAVISQKLGHSVRSALALLPVATPSTAGIGAVYTP